MKIIAKTKEEWVDELIEALPENAGNQELLRLMNQMGVPKDLRKDIMADLGIEAPNHQNKFSLTPEQWDLLQRMQNGKVIPARMFGDKNFPHGSRTIKALQKKDLVQQDRNGAFSLNARGEALLELTPRWSGDTQDEWGRGVKTWCVYDYGDHFSSFSYGDSRTDNAVELGDQHDRPNVFSALSPLLRRK